jgi:hypothetical protein
MKTMPQPKTPIRKRVIHWELLGLQGPAVTSIEEIRRQIISASRGGLSPDTMARTQRMGITPQALSKKTVVTQMQREGISKSRAKSLVPKRKY